MNSVTDPAIFRELYRTARAGLPIDLIVRGICMLRPGVPGVSENIRVRSIVGRFLEHTRVFAFENGGARDTYLGGADLMERNLDQRVEVLFPLHDSALAAYVRDSVLDAYLRDTERTMVLRLDGEYEAVAKPEDEESVDAQAFLSQHLPPHAGTDAIGHRAPAANASVARARRSS